MRRRLHPVQPWLGFGKLAFILALGFILASLTSCGSSKKDAQALVKAGTASSEQLVKYYDSLVQADTKYLRIMSYTVGPKFSPDEKKVLAQEKKAYASRLDLARKLNATYVALGQLIDFDVAGDIKAPVGDLTTAVLKQVPHPKDLDSDLFKTIISKIAGRLAEIQQEKLFRKNAPAVLEVLDGVGEIFERERPLYVQTAQLYEDEASKLALRAIGNKNCGSAQGTAIEMLEDLFEPYKVRLFSTPVTDTRLCEKNHDYFAAQIREMAHDRKVAARDEARRLSANLYNLERVHRNFLREKPTAPALLPSDLTNTGKLVAVLKEAMAKRADWEKQQQAHKKQQAQMKEQAQEQEPEQQQAESTLEPAEEAGSNDPDAEEPEYVPEKGAVADYVATLLSPTVKDVLEKGGDTSSNAFRKMLLEDLNRIIETGNVFEGILSKDGQKTLEEYRSSTSPGKRPGLRRSLIKFVSDTLASDRAKFTGTPGMPLPENITRLVIADPAGNALAKLNRSILAFVFENSIAPAV